VLSRSGLVSVQARSTLAPEEIHRLGGVEEPSLAGYGDPQHVVLTRSNPWLEMKDSRNGNIVDEDSGATKGSIAYLHTCRNWNATQTVGISKPTPESIKGGEVYLTRA
jgi:hypothetical protein